jgi:hypothetical protein
MSSQLIVDILRDGKKSLAELQQALDGKMSMMPMINNLTALRAAKRIDEQDGYFVLVESEEKKEKEIILTALNELLDLIPSGKEAHKREVLMKFFTRLMDAKSSPERESPKTEVSEDVYSDDERESARSCSVKSRLDQEQDPFADLESKILEFLKKAQVPMKAAQIAKKVLSPDAPKGSVNPTIHNLRRAGKIIGSGADGWSLKKKR